MPGATTSGPIRWPDPRGPCGPGRCHGNRDRPRRRSGASRRSIGVGPEVPVGRAGVVGTRIRRSRSCRPGPVLEHGPGPPPRSGRRPIVAGHRPGGPCGDLWTSMSSSDVARMALSWSGVSWKGNAASISLPGVSGPEGDRRRPDGAGRAPPAPGRSRPPRERTNLGAGEVRPAHAVELTGPAAGAEPWMASIWPGEGT